MLQKPKDLTGVARTIMTRLLEEDKIHGVTSIAVEEKEAEAEEEEQDMETATSLAAEAINSVIVGAMAGLDEGDLERLCPKAVTVGQCLIAIWARKNTCMNACDFIDEVNQFLCFCACDICENEDGCGTINCGE